MFVREARNTSIATSRLLHVEKKPVEFSTASMRETALPNKFVFNVVRQSCLARQSSDEFHRLVYTVYGS